MAIWSLLVPVYQCHLVPCHAQERPQKKWGQSMSDPSLSGLWWYPMTTADRWCATFSSLKKVCINSCLSRRIPEKNTFFKVSGLFSYLFFYLTLVLSLVSVLYTLCAPKAPKGFEHRTVLLWQQSLLITAQPCCCWISLRGPQIVTLRVGV